MKKIIKYQLKRYVIIGILIILLIAISAFFIQSGYLPIIGTKIASEKLSDYVREVYGSNETITAKYYLFGSSLYIAD